MHTPRQTRRLRRPAAAAALLALVGVLVPAGQAVADPVSSLSPIGGASERSGTTVTYDYSCQNTQSNLVPQWALLDSGYHQLTPMAVLHDAQTADGVSRGAFAVTYPPNASGGYILRLTCEDIIERTFSIAALPATTTTLVQQQSQITRGQSATLTAAVWPLSSGVVEFSAGGQVVATVPLDGQGGARADVSPTTTQTYTARFTGSETAQASPASQPVTVTVLGDVTAPETVSVAGSPVVGGTLGVSASGPWAPADTQLAYSWTVDGTEVGTAPTYVPSASDLGKQVRVAVTGSHAPLTPATRTSAPGVVVGLGSVPAGTVTLDGLDGHEAVLGRTITALASGFGDATLGYAWTVGGVAVPGHAATYTPTGADLGKMIRVTVTATAPGRTTAEISRSALPAVATPDVTVGSPTVTVGSDALVPVRVSGPAGAPVPSGSVTVTVTPRSGGTPVTLPAVTLDGSGAATVRVRDLAVGELTTAVAFAPVPSPRAAYAVASVDQSSNPYVAATGAGTITVTAVTPAVALADALAVPVATPGVLSATITGARLPATYVLREGATVLGGGPVPADGVLSAALPVLTPGSHTVTLDLPATTDTLAVSRTVTVTVAGEPVRAGALPTAQLDTPKAATAPGQRMQLVAEGFQPGESVAFYLHSDPVFLGTAVADASGVARLLADVPADTPAGAHTVVATGGTSGRWATLAVRLAVPDEQPGALAVTGASGGAATAAAWLLLLVGGALVVLARRARIAR